MEGAAYLIVYIVFWLMNLLFWLLAFGVPAFFLYKVVRNWGRWGRVAIWAAAIIIWAIPSAVEKLRDSQLEGWIAGLPPSPVVVLNPDRIVALRDGKFDPDLGQALFEECDIRDRYKHPLCDFELGPDDMIDGFELALFKEGAWRKYTWGKNPNCNIEQRYQSQRETFAQYMNVQGICAIYFALEAAPMGYEISLEHDTIPAFPNVEFGQLQLVDAETDEVLTTLTAFSMERPLYPVVWGVHWLPVLKNMTPRRTKDLRFGQTLEIEEMTGFPKGSLQALAYSDGWRISDRWTEPDLLGRLVEHFPYDPMATLPALRSNSFFPTRFAIEVVCNDRFKTQMTAEIAAELRRIATLDQRIGNSHPNRRAKEELAKGCAEGF